MQNLTIMKKTYTIGALLVALCFTANAQYTKIHESEDALYYTGLELYQQGQYTASKEMLEKYLAQEVKDIHFEEEAHYFIAANQFEMREKNAEKALQDYIKAHPYSTYRSDVYFMSGVFEVEKKKYSQACKNFKQVKEDELIDEHKTQFYFYYGYALLEQNVKSAGADDGKATKTKGKKSKKNKTTTKNSKKSGKVTTGNKSELTKAIAMFDKLRGKDNPYSLQSQYYYAYCYYLQQDYSKALPVFLKIEKTEEYKNIVPYYIVQIYYAKGEYDNVRERGESLLTNNPGNENNPEIHRILGEIYYKDKDYQKAAQHLSIYRQTESKPLRADIYELGLSYYQIGEYNKAIEALKKVTTKSDEMTESAYFNLGNAYVKINDKNNARLAFGAACNTDFDAQLHEEAKFNYALTTYESSDAFGESLTAFAEFLNEYPKSKHTQQAYEILTEIFLTSKNYQAALKAINSLKNQTKELQETKVYLTYQLGVEAFKQNHLTAAIDTFTSIIESKVKNISTYRTESYFWRSECQYKLRRYDKAAEDISSFFTQNDVKKSGNFVAAYYSAGYAYFSQKKYTMARSHFTKYVDFVNRKDPTYADALNRIGDCYFSQREFVSAEKYYAQVIAVGASGTDYAMFQRGYALGLLKRYNDKINALEKLVKSYPKSEFADDALYEIARANISKDDPDNAIKAYDRLITTYPRSPLARKAALEKGMTYANKEDYANAIEAYKQVIDKYPKSEEAYSAIDGLQAAYIETNNIKEFTDYTKDLTKKGLNVSGVKEDSLTYVAAERQYMNGNYQQATEGLKQYVSNYCEGGRYCTMARYYLADSYYRLNKKQDAMTYYASLTQIEGNPYMEEACIKAADIAYDNKQYSEALVYFQKLQTVASTTPNLTAAKLGVLRCSNHLGDNQTSISIATEIIEDETLSLDIKKEAAYNRMKAYIAQNNTDAALNDMQFVAQDMNTEHGAEAKYLLAKYYFDKEQLEQSEQHIMELAGSNTNQQYWLAKSFVLLADINVKRGEDFQAKQYLLSLRANYTVQDEIQEEINKRLEEIEKRLKEATKESGIL